MHDLLAQGAAASPVLLSLESRVIYARLERIIYSIEFLFSSERHYNLFPALRPSSDVTELKLKTLCLRLLCVKIWAGNSKFVFASFFKKYLGFPLPYEYDKGKLLLFRFYCWFL